MYSLKRNAEALAYFNLAQAIFNLELGSHHERTLMVSLLFIFRVCII